MNSLLISLFCVFMYMKFIISESQLSRLLSEEMKFLFSNAFVRYEGLNEWIVNLKFDYIDDKTEKIFSYDFELNISKRAFNEQNKPIEHCIWKLEMFEPDRVTFDYLDTTDEDTMNNIRSRVKWLFNQGDVKETVLKAISATKIYENKNYGNYTKKDILILMENEGEIEKDKKGFWDYRLDLHDLTETYFEFNLKLGNDIQNGDYIEYNIGGEITNEDSPYGEDWWIDVISQLYPEYKEINSDDIMWDYIVEVFESDMENILSNASESGKVIQRGGNAFRR